MDDDWTSCITVSIFLMLMIILCIQVQEFTLIYKDWNNLKCNPLMMIVNSMSQDSKKSLDDFSTCVNLVPETAASASVPRSSVNNYSKEYYGAS